MIFSVKSSDQEVNLAMWICERCGEEHGHQFAKCWKCGADQGGRQDDEFDVADPPDDDRVITIDRPIRPESFPTHVYYAAPLILGLWLVSHAGALRLDRIHRLTWTPLDLVLAVAFFISVVLPVTSTIADVVAFDRKRLAQNQPLSERRLLGLFRLPDLIQEKHSWFPAFYYGSLVLSLLAIAVVIVGKLVATP